jgi:DNA repair exonuclease SbcCD ATPase subunit
MKLSHLKIRNWCLIRNLDVRIAPESKIIMLSGDTGVGKSSLIDGIGTILSYGKGKSNAYGSTENITYGEETAAIDAGFTSRHGHQVELSKRFSTKSPTKASLLTNQGEKPITHSDKIKEELKRIFEVDLDTTVPLMIALQGEIQAPLTKDPSIRERSFLEQLNLKHVTDAEKRLLEKGNAIQIPEGIQENLLAAREELKRRQETVQNLKQAQLALTQEIAALEKGKTAWENWLHLQNSLERSQQLTGSLETLLNQKKGLTEKLTTLLGTETISDIRKKHRQISEQIHAVHTGFLLLRQKQKNGPILAELENLKNQLEKLQEKIGAFDPETEQKREALTNDLRKNDANLQAKEQTEAQLANLARLIQNHPITNMVKPNPKLIEEKRHQLADLQKNLLNQATHSRETEKQNAIIQKLQGEILELENTLTQEVYQNLEGKQKTFQKLASKRLREDLIAETLDNWGKPKARCPISFLELDPDATEAKALAEKELATLRALEATSDPQIHITKRAQIEENLRSKKEALLAAQTAKNEAAAHLNTVHALIGTLTPKEIQSEIDQLESAHENYTRQMADYTALIHNFTQAKIANDAWTNFTFLTAQEIADKTAEKKKLDEQAIQLDLHKKEINQIKTEINAKEPLAQEALTNTKVFQDWKNQHPNLDIENDPTLITRLTEKQAEMKHLLDRQATIDSIQDQIALLQKEKAALPKIETPAIPREIAKKAHEDWLAKKGEEKTNEKILAQADAEQKTAQKALDLAKKHLAQTQTKMEIKNAIKTAAHFLNYQNIPRQIAKEEFERNLKATNGILTEMDIPIQLNHTDFVIGATVKKDGHGTIQLKDARRKLSGGERTIVGIAMRIASHRRLAPNCRMLILDEPSVHLSAAKVGKLIEFFQNLKGKLSALGIEQIILVDHNPRLQSVADQVITW